MGKELKREKTAWKMKQDETQHGRRRRRRERVKTLKEKGKDEKTDFGRYR